MPRSEEIFLGQQSNGNEMDNPYIFRILMIEGMYDIVFGWYKIMMYLFHSCRENVSWNPFPFLFSPIFKAFREVTGSQMPLEGIITTFLYAYLYIAAMNQDVLVFSNTLFLPSRICSFFKKLSRYLTFFVCYASHNTINSESYPRKIHF